MTLFLGIIHCLFFQGLKYRTFLDLCAKCLVQRLPIISYESSKLDSHQTFPVQWYPCLKLFLIILLLLQCWNLKESSLKIGDLLLLITSLALATFIRFLARTFRNVCSTYTQTHLSHSCYILKITAHLLIERRFC